MENRPIKNSVLLSAKKLRPTDSLRRNNIRQGRPNNTINDIEPIHRAEINRILWEHGMKQDHELTQVRRYAIACPALPTCGLAVTESERVLSRALFRVKKSLAKLELIGEKISIPITGCPTAAQDPIRQISAWSVKLKGNTQLIWKGGLWVPVWRSCFARWFRSTRFTKSSCRCFCSSAR